MRLSLAKLAEWTGGAVIPPEAGGVIVSGVSTDSRTLQPGDIFVAISGERLDGHRFVKNAVAGGAVAAMVEKPVHDSPNLPVIKVDDTLFALGRMAHGYRWHPPLIPWVAITGSNGKTTTRELLSLMLRTRMRVRTSARNWNNFVGLPLSMMAAPDDAEVAVMELGTNAPGEIARLREIVVPTIGVVTSVGASHLAGLGSEAAVAREKGAIFDWLPTDGLAIYPADDRNAHILGPMVRHERQTYAISPCGADVEARDIRYSEHGTVFLVEDEEVRLPLLGVHNVSNCLAAMIAARRLGIPFRESALAVRWAKPVAGRLQPMLSIGGVRIINDSYNANPASMAAGLDVLASLPDSRKIAVLGDMLELGRDSRAHHRDIGLMAAMLGIDALFTVGPETVAMAEAAESTARIKVRHYASLEALWRGLSPYLRKGDWVLVKGSRGMKMERIVNEIMDWQPH